MIFRRHGTDPSLWTKSFRSLFLGQTISSLGDAFVPLACSFAIIHLGGSAKTIGLLLTTGLVTRICSLLVGGVWADRLPRGKTMVISDTVRALTQASIAAALISGYRELWPIFAGTVVYYAAAGVFIPASNGLIPEIVPTEHLQRANGMLASGNQSCLIFGQVSAGLLVAAFGPGAAFAIDAASFVGSAVFVSRIPPGRPQAYQKKRFWRDFRVGWAEIGKRGWYGFNLAMHALWNLGTSVFYVLGPVIMAAHYGGSAAWGFTLAGVSLGFVIGGAATARIRARHTVVIANAAGVLISVPLLLLAHTAPLYLLIITFVAGYAGAGLLDGIWRSMVQQLMPLEHLSRVSASNWIISLIAQPAGYILAGPLAAAAGQGATLSGAACATMLASALLVAWAWRAGIVRQQDGVFRYLASAGNSSA